MLSPTVPTPGPDPSIGVFANAQQSAATHALTLQNLDLQDVVPGETVVLADQTGEDVVGQIYIMSGGGKGPAGKSKTKYRSQFFHPKSSSKLMSPSCAV